jgi:cytoskeletal protein CcmA (bactofilin family)
MARVTRSGQATIGPSIVIRGEVSGDEDLLIQGQVDGSVSLDLHSVTVGGGGHVKANITGRVITIEGAVEGDLSAGEQIVLRGIARVQGDLKAPRVVLEDGASFRGLVDMGAPQEAREIGAVRRSGEAGRDAADKGGGASAGDAPLRGGPGKSEADAPKKDGQPGSQPGAGREARRAGTSP